MLVKELTEEEADRICDYYRRKYPRPDLCYYDRHKEGPCANCPLHVWMGEYEYDCGMYVQFRELDDEDIAAAKGEANV